MARVRVKFCGITRTEDALEAARLGVDAIGLMFMPISPRVVTAEQASQVCAQLPALVSRVGVFVNQSTDEINSILSRVSIDVLQFHGEETAEFCRSFNKPYVKVIAMQAHSDLNQVAASYPDASALLVDKYDKKRYGGTGETFDWAWLPKQREHNLILAGGLTPNNVASAIRTVQPYALDVSSGIESSKGIKDHQKMMAFMQEVSDVKI